MNSTVSKTQNGSQATSSDSSPLVIVVMGVSGCGKSTVAANIADGLTLRGMKVHAKDGDELHPTANIDKMASGQPLTDEDRQPWLEQVAVYAREKAELHNVCVIACSALKLRYRQTLNTAGQVVYVYLEGSRDLIGSRMHERSGHFMPESLLDSQFATLEDPRDEPHVLTVSIDATPEQVAEKAISLLELNNYIQPRR